MSLAELKRTLQPVELVEHIGGLACLALGEFLNKGHSVTAGLAAQTTLCSLFEIDNRTLRQRLIGGSFDSESTWEDSLANKGC